MKTDRNGGKIFYLFSLLYFSIEIARNRTRTEIDRYTETNKYGWKYNESEMGTENLHHDDTLRLTGYT
jgi:hypothetical protein